MYRLQEIEALFLQKSIGTLAVRRAFFEEKTFQDRSKLNDHILTFKVDEATSPLELSLQTKEEIRQHFRQQRQAITSKDRYRAAIQAAELLTESPLFKKSASIACYIPNDYEFDSLAIIDAIWLAGKTCYLPVLKTEKDLGFALYSPTSELKPNRYNILEPRHTLEIDKSALDMVLMPLVAFDFQGNRIGMGGGYYDRTFAFLIESDFIKPVLVGLAFENQYIQHLPSDSWDVKLTAVLTEKKFRLFNYLDVKAHNGS